MSESGLTPLEKAVISILKPLVRLVVKRGITVPQLSILLKYAYVSVARDDLTVNGRKSTIARIAVLTGLTRREASRLVQELEAPGTESPRRQFNRAARVLGGWVEDPTYQDKRGRPASLPFEGEGGATFSDLVRVYGSDVTPRSILDELMRVGSVIRTKDGRIRPSERGYVPHADEDAKLAILGEDVAELISSIDHNLTPGDAEPFFQRKVAYDNLPPSYLPTLRKLVRQDAQKLLERLSRDMSKYDRDVREGPPADEERARGRALLGIYYFEEVSDDED